MAVQNFSQLPWPRASSEAGHRWDMVRVKVVSHHPLPAAKVWFELSSLSSTRATIADLKSKLCDDIPSFVAADLTGDGIVLEIDDFELLDVSSVAVIAIGDVISIKEAPPKIEQAAASRKRKHVEDDELGHNAVKRLKIVDITAVPSLSRPWSVASRQVPPSDIDSTDSPESSETSSEGHEGDQDMQIASEASESSEEDSEDSDEDSESSSESSESDESSSESESSEQEILANRPVVNGGGPASTEILPNAINNNAVSVTPVPPGQGKTSTHARNLRRRKRLATLRAAGQSTPAAQAQSQTLSHLSTTPAASVCRPDPLPYDTPPPEGWRVNAAVSVSSAAALSSALKNKNKRKGFKKSMEGVIPHKTTFSSPTRRPRLVPPSERESLPSNVFITSVDCEARQYTTEGQSMAAEEIFDAVEKQDQSADALDWVVLEANWERYLPVQRVDALKEGDIVVWKAVALDQATSSPCMILQGAQVIKTSCGTACCVIRVVPRPGYYMLDNESTQAEVVNDDGSYEYSIDASGLSAKGCKLMIN